MNTLFTLLMMLWNLPTGVACCDHAEDHTSCSPFDYLADIGGVCDRTSIDAEISWCSAPHEKCWPMDEHTGEFRCCSLTQGITGRCLTPLGSLDLAGLDLIVACEADRTPLACDDWTWLGQDRWHCD